MADLDADYLDQLVDSWDLQMEVANKSPATRKLYRRGVAAYREWCATIGETASFDKTQVMRFIAACRGDYGRSASTTKDYLKGVKRFAAWAAQEGELTTRVGEIPPPALGTVALPSVTLETHQALLDTCDLATWIGKRDYAILRFLKAAGARASELVGMELPDLTVKTRRALLHGKGSKDRLVAFDSETALAIDRYLRARRGVKRSGETKRVWLAQGGQPLTYWGLDSMLTRRAEIAGVPAVNAHMWRHLWARSFLRDGGDRGNLKVLGGWKSNEMVEHYTSEDEAERALEAYDRLYGNRQ